MPCIAPGLTVEGGDQVEPDESVKPFMYYADVSFELVSDPA